MAESVPAVGDGAHACPGAAVVGVLFVLATSKPRTVPLYQTPNSVCTMQAPFTVFATVQGNVGFAAETASRLKSIAPRLSSIASPPYFVSLSPSFGAVRSTVKVVPIVGRFR